jgi:hypothetical protein
MMWLGFDPGPTTRGCWSRGGHDRTNSLGFGRGRRKRMSDMASFVFRCPATGLKVQGWFADDPTDLNGETYEAVTCVACTRVHAVNPKTGRVLGGDNE